MEKLDTPIPVVIILPCVSFIAHGTDFLGGMF